jgi:hypothetical protein
MKRLLNNIMKTCEVVDWLSNIQQILNKQTQYIFRNVEWYEIQYTIEERTINILNSIFCGHCRFGF